MGLWSNMFGKKDAEVVLREETEKMAQLEKLTVNLVDPDFVKEIENYVKQNRDFLRKNGNTLPTDVYSRVNGILDLIGRFLIEHVSVKGLSNEQRPYLRGTVTRKLPDAMTSFLDIKEADRTEKDVNTLTDTLIAVQKSVQDLRELALAGSLSDTVRFHTIQEQMQQRLLQDTTPGDARELFPH